MKLTAFNSIEDGINTFRIRFRDEFRCQGCGKNVSDGVLLSVALKIPVQNLSVPTDDEFWTVCDSCQQTIHDIFDLNLKEAEIQTVVIYSTGYARLKALNRIMPLKNLPVHCLKAFVHSYEWITVRNRLLRDGLMDGSSCL